ncbi:MAG: recombination protein RecR [Bdellovibrionales bacterium RIFOXYC1_FULL_54_43]|nr:MAG: recombination protein RecR [Bdellovibrionales bacterium RIFOXYC1_FULL_54_43]OFZ83229.1 MAG: recombination protein RecR [Bdellovibrionales bacterium RIFOXYD1_FULL_55_31]
MTTHHDPVSKLIFELAKLPGIGEKTATRLAYFILKQDESYSKALSEAVVKAKTSIRLCAECFTFTELPVCRVCTDPTRNRAIICIVERPSDVFSIEQTGAFRGVYHVLHGALSPLDGIGPEELKVRELLARLNQDQSPVQELILGTNPSVEGEATALYLSRLIKPIGLRVTQLAHGLPVGGMLEYTDRQTIGKALENRMEMT